MKLIPIIKIKPNPSNPRVIKDDKFAKLVKSLQDFPDMAKVRPIVVNQDMIVLGGNMRLKAMKEAGWKEAPVEIVDWPEDKQREFVIKDNVGFGEWDWQLIAAEWPEAEDWGLEINNFSIPTNEPEIDKDLLGQALETYINNTIKQIVLYYEDKKYESILVQLNKISEQEGLNDNSEVVEFLINKFYK